jgi:glucosamine-6-phosphate deaminase
MTRPASKLAPDWWDYTTIDPKLLRAAAKLTENDFFRLSRRGFQVEFHETTEDFYLAEALEYIEAWRQATASCPTGICGPIGPTEQLPLVARIVNALGLNLRHAHFWGMDEWVEKGKPVPPTHPLSFAKADWDLCFSRIDPTLRMPRENLHFPTGDLKAYSRSYDQIRCVVMQGGQGEIKHWAFNDPLPRSGKFRNRPPTPAEYRKLSTRVVDLHPVTIMQNARTSSGGDVSAVPSMACTVGPTETWKAERVSIWHAGMHDNSFGMRLTAYMIAHKIMDSAVPMSLLADHPDVRFHYHRQAIGRVATEMH